MEFFKELRRSSYTGHDIHHQAGEPILQADGLGLRYDTNLILEDISFSLQPGERVAVVGPNGAGKSTLFKIIAGVLAPTRGEVKVYGQHPVSHICIAYVPQRSQVDWAFPVSVADVVMMGRAGRLGMLRWPGRADWDFIQRCLEEVGLGDLATRQISELSGGQQQRMFIARALSQQAELMLMDEPLSGLDVNSQEAIFGILDEVRKRGVTVMLATHDLDQAAGRFDRVMLLNRRLISFAPAAQALTTAQLLQAFGGQLRVVGPEGGDEKLVTLVDSCCGDGEEP